LDEQAWVTGLLRVNSSSIVRPHLATKAAIRPETSHGRWYACTLTLAGEAIYNARFGDFVG